MIKTIAKGTILIAKPLLYDENFDRTVVLLTEHTQSGSVGFIMNKPLDIIIKDIFPETNSKLLLYEGGPVGMESIYYIHNRPDLIENSVHIEHDLYWSGNFEQVLEALKQNLLDENNIRFFLGYSGWSENQLEEECESNSWHLYNKKLDLEFFKEDTHTIWQKMIKKIGGKSLIWFNTPENPEFN